MRNEKGKVMSTSMALKHIANFALFAKIVEIGGISRCASDLGLERTTVSRRLAGLEQDLGVKLLNRTPKRVYPTEAGQRCFEQCELILEAARAAEYAAITGLSAVESPTIVVGAPPDVLDGFLSEILTKFETRNRNIAIECHPMSEVGRGMFDLVDILIAWERPIDSSAIATRVTGIKQSIYASPAYLARHDEPISPFDLDDHVCITQGRQGTRQLWAFSSGSESIRKTVNGRFAVSGHLQARETTLAGLGIGRLPNYMCEPYVEEGRLVRLFKDYVPEPCELHIITLKKESSKPRATGLRMYLEDAFRSLDL